MNTTNNGPKVAVLPKSGRHESLAEAVVAGGGVLATIDQADALVWADPSLPHLLRQTLDNGPNVRWIALPFAGIEPYVPYLDSERTWTCAKGVYATPVAEHILANALAGFRQLHTFARASEWSDQIGRNLYGSRVVVFGGGGITTEFLRLLEPFGCHVTVVRRSTAPFAGADKTVSLAERLEVLARADLVVLALALTDETRGVIGYEELEAMPADSWLVNVARGGHVQTDALAEALRSGSIGGAVLDVTEPEPLPSDHPLWSEPRAIITPHVGNTPEMGIPLLAKHIAENVRRFGADLPLDGVVDVEAGY